MRVVDFSDGFTSASAPTALPVAFPDGSLAAPGLYFTNDTDCGMYRIGANNWALVAGGAAMVSLTATTVTFGTTILLAHTTTTSEFALKNNADVGSVGFYGGSNVASARLTLYGSTHASLAKTALFITNSATVGSFDANGKWTIGAASGTQIHAINGGMSITLPITMSENATPAAPSAGSRKLYPKTDGCWYTESSGSVESFIGLPPSSEVVVDTGNGYGSTNTVIRRFTNNSVTGSDITYADSVANGATFTIATAGLYSLSYTDFFGAARRAIGFSLNSAQLTTNIQSITAANRLMHTFTGSATSAADQTMVAVAVRLAVSDVIRIHTDGGTPGTESTLTKFRIIRVA